MARLWSLTALMRTLAAAAMACLALHSAAQTRPGPTVIPWRAVETSASFVEGHAGPVVAAFIDLDCSYCSQLWRRLRAPLAQGRVRVRWIPVAVLSPDRAARATALLHAPDPIAALAAHESRARATAVLPPASAIVAEEIAANNALLAALTHGRPATPLLVSRGADLAPRVVPGVPQDLDALLDSAR